MTEEVKVAYEEKALNLWFFLSVTDLVNKKLEPI